MDSRPFPRDSREALPSQGTSLRAEDDVDPGFREHGAAHLAGPQRERGVLERLLHLPSPECSQVPPSLG